MEQIVFYKIDLDGFFNKIAQVIENKIEQIEQSKTERLLSAEEARAVFSPNISKVTLYSWTKKGLIPCHRIGGRIFYKHSEIITSAKRITKFERDKI